ncbi:hypothetical protein BDN70DRAFT_796153 [Pholiota conissans]|uniref:WKF domain-containing protein n=1 Tax=Pholiota conissans TaxID=109636 RepID=A0A9P6D6B7_9AGAR|nr:hypothetical protein BDN70DRAFT_796153 [Pholiota conissans]
MPPASETTESAPTKASKKKSTRLPTPKETHIPPEESTKISKKRKNRSEHFESEKDKAGSSAKDTPEEPPKKKHRNRTEFTDPRDDTTLNAQSRKALEYAFLQMNRPSKWKFNKARQNWLIRNIWNPEAVSDIYFPFVLKYLTNVQGGSRNKLKETCQTYMKLPEITETPTQAGEVVILPPKSILKRSTSSTHLLIPGPLVDFLPTPGALISLDSTPLPASTTGTSAVESLAVIKKKRAQTLYDVLCSGTVP